MSDDGNLMGLPPFPVGYRATGLLLHVTSLALHRRNAVRGSPSMVTGSDNAVEPDKRRSTR